MVRYKHGSYKMEQIVVRCELLYKMRFRREKTANGRLIDREVYNTS